MPVDLTPINRDQMRRDDRAELVAFFLSARGFLAMALALIAITGIWIIADQVMAYAVEWKG